jgi:predicted Zn-dependent peptidase
MKQATPSPELVHRSLDCGVEFAASVLQGRPTVALEIRVLAGASQDPAEQLGLTRLAEETLDKGTERRSGRALLDAFDAIGAQRGSSAGRDTTAFTCVVLPEFLESALGLHAEMLRTPTFPQEACEVAVQLALQELTALEDDPHSLCDKLLTRQAYGPLLGRHPLGERETLERIDRDATAAQWRRLYAAGRMLVCVAGPIEPDRVADQIEQAFEGFGSPARLGREPIPIEFRAARSHHTKELEQQHIGICYPGVPVDDDEYPVERVLLGVLSGGMSARLFTEVREKQGLVYWVGAWHEHPRAAGMIHLGASTTPERCDQTFKTLLREVDRLSDDLTDEEVQRAIVGIVARTSTRGDITRAHCSELVSDLFHRGRPVPMEEKLAKVQAVDVAAIQEYLDRHPRDALSVLTLGPKELRREDSGRRTQD